MSLESEEKKQRQFADFLEIAKMLNDSFSIQPILFGSFGLGRVIDIDFAAEDIDLLVDPLFFVKTGSATISFLDPFSIPINDRGMNKIITSTKSFLGHACQFCGSERKLVETLIDDEFYWDEQSGMYQPNGFTDAFEHTGNDRCAQCHRPWSGK